MKRKICFLLLLFLCLSLRQICAQSDGFFNSTSVLPVLPPVLPMDSIKHDSYIFVDGMIEVESLEMESVVPLEGGLLVLAVCGLSYVVCKMKGGSGV